MQTLEQLTDVSKSAWGTISQWIEHARNHCDVIKKDQSSAERELFHHANAHFFSNGSGHL